MFDLSFFKRSWPMVIGGAVIVIGVSVSLLVYAISGVGRKDQTSLVIAATSTSSFVGQALGARHLDGVLVATSSVSLPVYAVMVENAPDARPLSGPARASVVIEAPVEGGFTRFLLLFDASTTVDMIGPVRSARPYFVEWADALHAAYAHVGGSQDGLKLISMLKGFRNIDEFRDSLSFWRSKARPMPHNAYTKADLLTSKWQRAAWSFESFTPWHYLETSSTNVGKVIDLSVRYGGAFDVDWRFNSSTRQYARLQSGRLQKDEDGTIVTASNIIVLQTDAKVLDEVGRLKLRTTGSGPGFVYRDGQRFEVTWHRRDGEWLSFTGVDGSDVLFERGTTWIEMVTSNKQLAN